MRSYLSLIDAPTAVHILGTLPAGIIAHEFNDSSFTLTSQSTVHSLTSPINPRAHPNYPEVLTEVTTHAVVVQGIDQNFSSVTYDNGRLFVTIAKRCFPTLPHRNKREGTPLLKTPAYINLPLKRRIDPFLDNWDGPWGLMGLVREWIVCCDVIVKEKSLNSYTILPGGHSLVKYTSVGVFTSVKNGANVSYSSIGGYYVDTGESTYSGMLPGSMLTPRTIRVPYTLALICRSKI